MIFEELKKDEEVQNEEDLIETLLWNQREVWRRRPMYRGWMLEDVIEKFSEHAVITRSFLGYRVLNTPLLGVIDVDFNHEAHDIGPEQSETISNLEQWIVENPNQSWRVYKTAGGMRLLRTDAPQPLDCSYDAVYRAIGCGDDLYRQLCHEQQAFRLRLTPKPRRCGVEMPIWSPYEGFIESERLPLAIKAYEILADQYKVCNLVETIGSGIIHPELRPLVALHDERCKVFTNLEMEQLHRSETSKPPLMACVEFNEVYRPEGMAPDLIWNVLSHDAQLTLRDLDHPRARERVRQEHGRMQRLFDKWMPTYKIDH